jgi:hypothetical protein
MLAKTFHAERSGSDTATPAALFLGAALFRPAEGGVPISASADSDHLSRRNTA